MELNKVTALHAVTRDVEITVGEETLHVTVRPMGISIDTQRRLLALDKALSSKKSTPTQVADALTALPKALSEVVLSWDLEMDGKPVGTDPKSLEALPLETTKWLFEEIQGAATESPKA